MHVLVVDGPVPATWALDEEADEERLRRAVADITLQGFPGGATLEVADGRRTFRAQFVVGVERDLAEPDHKASRDQVLNGLSGLGVETAACTCGLPTLPPTGA